MAWLALLLLLLGVASYPGCSGGGGSTAPAAEDVKLPPPRTLAIPGAPTPQAPPRALVWEIPSGWVAVEPGSPMRLAQYRVAGPGGEAECVVYYFGPGQGGDPQANAARWAGQFTQPGGGSSLERMRLAELEGTAVPVHVVEITGTYDGGMTMTERPADPRPDSMLLGGIALGPDAPWFFKFTGPETTVRAEREAFLRLMRSVRPGA